jgi:phage baseplate assembly protein V
MGNPRGSWNVIRGGAITAVNDAGAIQTAQVKLSYMETYSDRPVMQMFGFASSPPINSDVVLFSPNGDPSSGIIIGTNHQPSRLVDLPAGGARLYDEGGRQVVLDNTGLIQLFAKGEVLHRLMTEIARDVYNIHTHHVTSVGGETAVPTQQMTDAHLTTATRAGT